MRTGRTFSWRLRTVLSALALLIGLTSEAAAQQPALESAVKATFLHRFGAFAEWPPTAFAAPNAPVVICVSGAPAFAAVVERATGSELIGGRQVSVRALGSVSRNSGCHILYVAGTSGQSVADALRVVRGEPVLTVTDANNGATRGAVHFVLASDRVRFHIDRGAAEGNHVNLSSRLLDIALSVRRRGGSGAR